MTPYLLTILLTLACFLVACFRVRWVALSLAPPVLLILAREGGAVDISSASHPLRLVVPLLSLSLAVWAAGWYRAEVAYWTPHSHLPPGPNTRTRHMEATRALAASIIVFASGCTDVPALFLWELPGEWVLVYVQMLACFLILAVLLLPERWLPWTTGS